MNLNISPNHLFKEFFEAWSNKKGNIFFLPGSTILKLHVKSYSNLFNCLSIFTIISCFGERLTFYAVKKIHSKGLIISIAQIKNIFEIF